MPISSAGACVTQAPELDMADSLLPVGAKVKQPSSTKRRVKTLHPPPELIGQSARVFLCGDGGFALLFLAAMRNLKTV